MFFVMHIVVTIGTQKGIKRMTSKNDITGDSIRTKISKDNKQYGDAWEKIWGNKKEHEGSNGTDRNPPSGTKYLTKREKVLMDPLEASKRSDKK
tara:strand:+ start:870 stop:1151 length:282 start_codon:yes stop_codon:yes gene_type:complete